MGLVVAVLAGCGRVGFDAGGAAGDAFAGEDAPPFGMMPSGDGGTVPVVGRVSCLGVLQEDPAAPDGTYTIDPDGAGPRGALTASCDMTTDGGGWTLVLAHVHRAGTSPSLDVRSGSLPLLGGDTLGADEAGAASWGHAGAALLAQLPFNELRFACRTSAHARIVDFRTVAASCLDYARTGVGFCGGARADYVPLAGHTGMLPLEATHVTGDAGDFALTENTLFKNTMPKANWVASPASGQWACDAQAQGAGVDTIHRVWIR